MVTLAGSDVVEWRNLLSEGSKFEQLTANRRAAHDTLDNGLVIIDFRNSNNFLTLNHEISPKAIMVIGKLDGFPNYARIIDRGAANDCGIHIRPGGIEGRFDDVVSKRTIFGSADTSYTAISIITSGATTEAFGRIGLTTTFLGMDKTWLEGNYQLGRNGLSFNGQVLEVSIFNDLLTNEELIAYETSRFNYYSPPPELAQSDTLFISDFCPTTITPGSYFVSYQWSTGEVSPEISAVKTGWYKVTVEDMFSRIFSDSVYVQYPGHFITDFSLCSNEERLWDLELGEDFAFTWQDGTTDGEYLITQAGTYQVTVEDNAGCSYTHQVEVTLDDFPHTVDIAEPSPFCLGNDLHLSGGFDGAQLYFWSTGSTAPFITPQESGTYWVEVSNLNNCIGRDTVEVDIVGEAPEVAFTTGPVCIDNPVTFQDATEPEAGTTPVAWAWYLGNDTLHSESAQATYHQTGPVPVALTLTLDNGCTGTARDTILVNPLPEVNFSAPIVCAGNEAFFESFATVPDGEIFDLLWNFGNNTTDQGVIGSTVFQNLGDNTVTLTATSTAGCVDSLSRTVEVLGSPVADFEFQNVCIGQTMAFNELVDTQESGPVFYRWSFGDGFFSNFPNTGHQYAAPGAYDVTLTATGNNLGANGCKDTITKTVIVFPPPTAQAAANDTCFGTPLTLADLTPPKVIADTPDPVVDRLWTLTESPSGGGGVLGEDSLLNWIPDLPGAHAVRLDVVTAAGCHAHKVTNLSILPAPHADFALELPVQAPPITVQPQNTSLGATHHQWFLNGEPVATAPDPEITFPDTGQYTLTLVAANELLCADTVSKHFRVIIPRYDIVLGELYPQVQNGRLRIQAALYNAGNTPVHTFDARAQVGHNPEVAFTQNASIPPGNTVLHEFTTAFEWRAADLPYVCLWVGNPDGIDQNPDAPAEADITNNYRCAALPVSEPIISDPRPNPATHEVHLSVVLPRAATATLDLIDPSGRTIRSSRQPLPEGYSPFTMDVSNLQPGMYLLRLEIGEEVIVRRIVVK